MLLSLRRVVALGVVLSLCLPAASAARAQALTLGVRNGVVHSTIQGDLFYRPLPVGDGQVHKTYQTGVQMTGFLVVPLSDHFSFQGEIQYAQKGAAVRGTRTDSACGGPLADCIRPSLDETYRMSYIHLPLLLTAHWALSRHLGLRVLTGPSVDLLLDTRITTASLRESALPENALSPMSHETLSAIGGMEVQYDVSGGGALLLGVRYHSGLTTFELVNVDHTLRSRAYAVSLGYRFSL